MKTDGNLYINQLLDSMPIFGRTCGGRIFLKSDSESAVTKVRALDHFSVRQLG